MASEEDGEIAVLYVEDDADLASLTVDALEREDNRITVATVPDAEAGLDQLEATSYDCIVSDYEMPGQDGIEFLRTVRERWPDLPFILYTGRGSEAVASDAVSAGVTDYLQKETGIDQYTLLANRIDNAVKHTRATSRLETLEHRYRSLFTEMNEGVVLHELVFEDGEPVDYRLLEVNEAFEATLDLTAEDVVGKPATDIYESDEPPYLDRCATVVETGDPIEFETYYPPLEKHFHVSVFSPEAGQFATVFTDITERKQRERDLEMAETFFEHTQDGAFLVDVTDDGFVIDRVNPAYETQSGIDAEEIEGQTPREAVGEDQGAKIAARYRECLKRREPIEYEEAIYLDGERTVWWTRVAPVIVEDTVEYLVGSTREISARKQREQDRERLKSAVENAGHAVYFTDRDGTINYVNPAFERITGYDSDEAIGENPQILKSGEMAEAYYDDMWETLLSGERWEEEIINERKTGEHYTAHQTIAPIEADGEITGFVAIQADISDRKAREQELARLADHLKLVVEGTDLGIWDWDLRTDEVTFNDQWGEILGYDRATIQADREGWEQLVHPDDLPAVETKIETHLDGKTERYEAEHRLQTAEGDWKWIRTVGGVVERDDSGEPVRVVGVHVDISEQKTRERQLERSRDLLAHSQRLANVGAWEYDVESGTVRTTTQFSQLFDLDVDSEPTLEAVTAVFHPEDRERVKTAFDRAREYGLGFDYRVRIDRDDDQRWVRIVGEPLTDTGAVTAVRGAVRDITAEYRHRQHLEANDRALLDLQDVLTDADRSFDEKIEAIIEIGRERVGLSVGYLTAIEDGVVELSTLTGESDQLSAGQQLPLEDTFCETVVEREDVFSIYDAPGQGFDDEPAYQQFGISAYVGAPLFVDGDLQGTICFVAQDARDEPFSTLELTFVRNLVQQVGALFADRRRRQQLRSLHEATRSLFDVESANAIPAQTIDAIEGTAETVPLAFYRWDDETGTLERVARSVPTSQNSVFEETVGPDDGPIWEAFVREDPALDALDPGDHESEPSSRLLAVPIGDVGVLAADRQHGPEQTDFARQFVETLARNVTAAYKSVEQRERLQEYTARLERQNERLERLRRINAIIRDIQQTIVEATTRSAVEDAVCQNLASIDHWELAWIGTPSVTDPGFALRAASDDRAEAFATIGDDSADTSIASRAIEQQRIVEVPNIVSSDTSGPWRRTALEMGYQAAVAIPISYGTREYGVLEIYADQPGVFADEERTVLAELGTTIAYAITSLERDRSLQSGGGVELELTIPSGEEFLLSLGSLTDSELTVTSVVQRSDGNYLAYATAPDIGPVAESLAAEPMVERATTFGAEGDEQIELAFRESTMLAILGTHGARLHRLVADERTNRLTVYVPRTDQVRAFVEDLQDTYADLTLHAQRTVEADRTMSLAGALEGLTDRQQEILTIAYRRGFFEWPRESSGEEIADAIGIAPATFHQHVRTVQRNVLQLLFESVD
ncbi:PAS domain S-box protein [Halorhabdus salina]|uniref:PAS domain S-box protein n=1 Tax=Halorhabdus salina TaxID=2750670 RepID=UPI0015EF04B5|nr:PAS domain S-box protein [Halorhabdus salina]